MARQYAIPAYRISLVKDGSVRIDERPQVRSSNDAYEAVRDWFLDKDREEFVVIMLNVKNKIIGISSISVGSLTSSLVHPREVFKPLILHNAAAVILSHNHPSGDPTPSQDDINITSRLKEIGEIMGIKILDHIIVGDGKFISFLDDGYFPRG